MIGKIKSLCCCIIIFFTIITLLGCNSNKNISYSSDRKQLITLSQFNSYMKYNTKYKVNDGFYINTSDFNIIERHNLSNVMENLKSNSYIMSNELSLLYASFLYEKDASKFFAIMKNHFSDSTIINLIKGENFEKCEIVDNKNKYICIFTKVENTIIIGVSNYEKKNILYKILYNLKY